MPISITSDESGSIHLPDRFGIHPKEKLFVDKIDNIIVIKKANKEAGKKIAKILEKNLKDADFKEMEKDREDREW